MYLPRINAALQTFLGQWNYHGLSTEHGENPREIFASGLVQNMHSSLTAVRDVFDRDGVPSTQTCEGSDDIPADIEQRIHGRTRVDVPSTDCPLTDEQVQLVLQELQSMSVPEADKLGVTFYLRARAMARDMLSRPPHS